MTSETIRVLESSATEIDLGAVQEAPLGNGGKCDNGARRANNEREFQFRGGIVQSMITFASQSDTEINH